MAERNPSWIDYLNLGLTTLVGGLGVYVAVTLGRSADQLSQNNLVVQSATFLLDDSPQRRTAGVQIVSWLQESQVSLPKWEQDIVAQVASQSTLQAPTQDADAAAPSPAPAPGAAGASPATRPAAAAKTAEQQLADQLFRTVGGLVPRMFIEIADPAQQAAAEELRRAVGQQRLGGQLVVVPRIETVARPSERLQLRFLKKADQAEAQALAQVLVGLLGEPVAVRDMSERYGTDAAVKARTYELWFPRGEQISLR